MSFYRLFPDRKPVIAMLHLLPLPGSPAYGGDLGVIYERAEWEAHTLVEAGVDALIVENFGDEPYQIGEPPSEQLALMAAVTHQIVRSVEIPVGVNVQFNAWQTEMAIAHTCEADFVRVEVFVDTVVCAQGIVQPCSAQIMRCRKTLGAHQVGIWANLQTKYTTNIVPQTITQSAEDAYSAGADALIVTGGATGQATPLDDVKQVREVVELPVLVGSGTRIDNVSQVLETADGAIVGSSLKEGGRAENPVSKEAAEAFMQVVGR